MENFINTFSQYPRTVRTAFITFVAAWCWHYFSLYMYFLKGEVPIEQIAIGLMLFISLVLFKKWGRILSIVFNSLAIIWYLWLTSQFMFADKQSLITVAMVNVVLFGLSALYLFHKNTAAFFKLMAEKKEKEKAQEIEEHVKNSALLRKRKKKDK